MCLEAKGLDRIETRTPALVPAPNVEYEVFSSDDSGNHKRLTKPLRILILL
jgi:hypothetical protein